MSLDVGARLKVIRKKRGLSQRELAKRAGVTNSTISLIEQNRVSPSVSSLKKVLDGVPMSLQTFFVEEVPEQARGRGGAAARPSGAGGPALAAAGGFAHVWDPLAHVSRPCPLRHCRG